jgi:Domain of unknown function (DUF4372)
MHQGKLVFSQRMMYFPLSIFRRCVTSHRGDHKVKDFTGCLDGRAFGAMRWRLLHPTTSAVGCNNRRALQRRGWMS